MTKSGVTLTRVMPISLAKGRGSGCMERLLEAVYWASSVGGRQEINDPAGKQQGFRTSSEMVARAARPIAAWPERSGRGLATASELSRIRPRGAEPRDGAA